MIAYKRSEIVNGTGFAPDARFMVMPFYTLAVTHYGERLRDTNIAVSVWTSYEKAIAVVREDFADEIEDLDDEERRDDALLLEHLRDYCNIVISIDRQGPQR